MREQETYVRSLRKLERDSSAVENERHLQAPASTPVSPGSTPCAPLLLRISSGTRIKNACQTLRTLVPGLSDKTDKATVFEFTVQYLLHLRRHLGTKHDKKDAKVGDEFMRQIEPIAAYVPYMTAVGNHESKYNFSNYANRFSMMDKSGTLNNFFYSFNIGPAHIISYSTEFYFYLKYGWQQVPRQYRWLEKDLQEANLPENRSKRPWIITMSHRPMYCSNTGFRDCNSEESIARKGFPLTKMYGPEKLFFKYGVDLHFTGHQHSYERLWPVYDGVVYKGNGTDPYVNPRAPVHVVTGAAKPEVVDSVFIVKDKPRNF
ncbi:hypothetical protein HPB51_015404 [Rhipicephalus microplus]|uniref:BHLH domain-containing protein n=1 Tax=Rhipicephalus microplus TaxID=6941 RepID=A0A9J6DV31_RHIMP|nr:hypothetical protein HPB51_015404 [Rhipicephalus microplus]